MTSLCRCRQTLLILFVSAVFGVVLVTLHNNRLLSKYAEPEAATACCQCPGEQAEESLRHAQLRHSSSSAQGSGNDGKTTAKKNTQTTKERGSVFNFGELLRGEDDDVSADRDAVRDLDLSADEIEQLKSQNLCPQPHRLDQEFLHQHEKITQTSSYTLVTQNLTSTGQHNFTALNQRRVLDLLNARSRVVILTPISNSAKNLQHYFKLLCSLSYPHELLSVALGEDSSSDRSFELAHVHARTLKQYFARVDVMHFSDTAPESRFGKHDEFFQFKRRRHLAHARNQLLFRGLRDDDDAYVLWIDVDVKYVPPDIVQHLIAADKDVVVPSCMMQNPDASLTVYDRNSWRETDRSRATSGGIGQSTAAAGQLPRMSSRSAANCSADSGVTAEMSGAPGQASSVNVTPAASRGPL